MPGAARWLLGLLLLLAAGDPARGQAPVAWAEEEVGVGVVLKTAATTIESLPQTVSVLEVRPGKTGARLAFVSPGGFRALPDLARPTRAVAGVNGGFFTPQARSVGMLRVEGRVFGEAHRDRTSAIVLDERGRFAIETDPTGKFPKRSNVMSAGPRLVRKGEVPSHATRWSAARHPRTAIGVRKDGVIVIVSIDGRTAASRGVSLIALARYMKSLACRDALNLDGGGSTTMWVRGEPHRGIVNFPCDNRKHDRLGARKIPNAIVVLARDVVVQDEDEAVLSPAASWEVRRDGRGFFGATWARSTSAGASATWKIDLDFTGAWRVEIRGPKRYELTPAARVRCRALDARYDQRAHGGRWRSLGTIELDSPGTVEVVLSSEDELPLAVDAVRLVHQN